MPVLSASQGATAASGLLTLVTFAFQSTIQVHGLVKSFQCHQQRVRDLLYRLAALSGVWASLTDIVEAIQDVDVSGLKIPLQRCDKACQNLQNKNEAKSVQDISRLIVPSAEHLALFGAKDLDVLVESVNEGWNNSIPLIKTRPQPDYSAGFRRSGFKTSSSRNCSPLSASWWTCRTSWPHTTCTSHS